MDETPSGDASKCSFQREQADALVELCRSYLAGGEQKLAVAARIITSTVHVDERALKLDPTQSSKSDLPIETDAGAAMARLCRPSRTQQVIHPARALHRVVNPQLKRAETGA